MAWLSILSSVVVAWVMWNSISLWINYRTARRIGLPIIVSPVAALNPMWILAHRFLPLLPFLQSLPLDLGKWARCSFMGWTFQDKYLLHQELGLVFVLVTPSLNEVFVADPVAAHTVLSKRKEFIKPAVMYGTYCRVM